MSTHDPYDFIEWHPGHNRSGRFILKRERDHSLGGRHTGKKGKQRMGYIYDLITLCTLAAVIGTLLNLSLSWR